MPFTLFMFTFNVNVFCKQISFSGIRHFKKSTILTLICIKTV